MYSDQPIRGKSTPTTTSPCSSALLHVLLHTESHASEERFSMLKSRGAAECGGVIQPQRRWRRGEIK
ncbi:hypothetical protein NQZ68_022765 [Dissostichus eleginoides]|nr:hypothetical protein NQZ68_022765 [Dissostichus eleginoides]